MVDLLSLIPALRLDLCRRFGTNQPQNSADYLAWLLTNGVKEYQALLNDATFIDRLGNRDQTWGVTVLQAAIYRSRPDVRKVFALPAQRDYFEQWFWCHGVGEHKLWPWLTAVERELALKVAQQTQSPWLEVLLGHATKAQKLSTDLSQTSKALPWGVNLVGYAFGQLGIGEDLRMTALALKAAAVPLAIVNFPPSKDIPQNDRSLQKWVLPDGRLGPYAINLFCMTALETGRFFAERGSEQFQNRYNIGYWPWELSKWPDSWKLVHPLVDEAWVSTRHIQNALKPTFSSPIQIMPLVVAPEKERHQWREPVERNATRRKFRLPLKASLFCFSFDLNSSIHRKNPQACIEAFLRAFPRGELTRSQVGLVIKTHALKKGHRGWEKLKSLAALDDRIHIIEGTLQRRDLMALYSGCDVFVSLHRAEGFGRAIAEALQLGLHVIATDYSGNTDFCHRPEFSEQISLIPYRLVRVRAGQYPYADTQLWASPNVNAAAKAMRICQQAKSMGSQVPRGGWQCFSAKVLGKLYEKRLQNIFANFYT